jgi:hypothetical protein
MDEQRLLELIGRIASLGEEYGAAQATKSSADKLANLRHQYDMYMEEIRKIIAPPQWGVSPSRMAGKTATAAKIQHAQMLHQMISNLGLHPLKKEPEDDHNIEFSL